MPQGEADLRIFAHDALAPHHDQDYRGLLAPPPRATTFLEYMRLNVLLIDYGGKVRWKRLIGPKADGESPEAWMFIHRARAQAMGPPRPPKRAPGRKGGRGARNPGK